MCGITAYVSFTKIDNQLINKLQACNRDMIYRGPDEQDVWHYEKVALAQVRLSIIGVNNGHQPLFNESRNIVLICNGEIYNYKELKQELQNKGHSFSSESDSEVILHLYEEYGEQLNDKLDGMFAYCLYDIEKQKIVVGRDFAGKKPLYFAQTPEGFVFSSELKAIKNHFFINPQINHEVLRQTQKYSYSISIEDTYVKGIHKIPFASYGLVDLKNGNEFQVHRYYKRYIKSIFSGDYVEACKKVRELLFKAVEKRLQSEVPIAVLLSAGIDSSAIACITREYRENVHVLSAGYEGKHIVDEREEAKRLSYEKGFLWNEIELKESDFLNNLQNIFSILDEPNGDVAMFAQSEIYKKAKEKKFTVLLSGNGGDELFFGYSGHNDYALGLQWIEQQKSLMPMKSKVDVLKLLIKSLLKVGALGKDNFLEKINIRYDYPVFNELLQKALLQQIPLEREDWHRINFDNQLDKVYYFLNYAWLTNNCYFLGDKLAMAHSVEVRSPFADRDLISFVDTLPIEYKFRNALPKQILKDSLKGVLPDYIIQRKKTGFTPPTGFVNKLIEQYQPSYFKEKPATFAQLATDYFANKI
jgi:asparagine synthase (glutamine-hydrolysing)